MCHWQPPCNKLHKRGKEYRNQIVPRREDCGCILFYVECLYFSHTYKTNITNKCIFQQRVKCSFSSGKGIMFQFLLKETKSVPSYSECSSCGLLYSLLLHSSVDPLVTWIALATSTSFKPLSFAELAVINPSSYWNRTAFKWKAPQKYKHPFNISSFKNYILTLIC